MIKIIILRVSITKARPKVKFLVMFSSKIMKRYRIGGIFRGEKILQILCFRKNYTQKTKIYMVHTLFLPDLKKFNPTKYTTYTVVDLLELPYSVRKLCISY